MLWFCMIVWSRNVSIMCITCCNVQRISSGLPTTNNVKVRPLFYYTLYFPLFIFGYLRPRWAVLQVSECYDDCGCLWDFTLMWKKLFKNYSIAFLYCILMLNTPSFTVMMLYINTTKTKSLYLDIFSAFETNKHRYQVQMWKVESSICLPN